MRVSPVGPLHPLKKPYNRGPPTYVNRAAERLRNWHQKFYKKKLITEIRTRASCAPSPRSGDSRHPLSLSLSYKRMGLPLLSQGQCAYILSLCYMPFAKIEATRQRAPKRKLNHLQCYAPLSFCWFAFGRFLLYTLLIQPHCNKCH